MNLDPGGTTASDIAWAEQEVTNSSALAHTLQFEVRGAPGDKIELRVGTATTGSQIVADVVFSVGYHTYTFTSTAANFFVQFRAKGTDQDKVVSIDNVALLDNAAVELVTPYATAD